MPAEGARSHESLCDFMRVVKRRRKVNEPRGRRWIPEHGMQEEFFLEDFATKWEANGSFPKRVDGTELGDIGGFPFLGWSRAGSFFSSNGRCARYDSLDGLGVLDANTL